MKIWEEVYQVSYIPGLLCEYYYRWSLHFVGFPRSGPRNVFRLIRHCHEIRAIEFTEIMSRYDLAMGSNQLLSTNNHILIIILKHSCHITKTSYNKKKDKETYWICSWEPPEVAFEIAHAASFLISNSACWRRCTRGKIILASITACRTWINKE